MPSFPASVNNVSSINLDYVVVKKNSTLMAANATISSSSSAASASGSSQAASGSASGSATATVSGSSASASTSQKSGADRMGASMALVLGVAIVGGVMAL